ncbi:MAG: sensor histidine kinase [Thermoplasmatota archaeon]
MTLFDVEHVEALAISAMGVVLVIVGATDLGRKRVLEPLPALCLTLAGLAAFFWKAPLFVGYSEDDYPIVEFQETLFFLFLAACIFFWFGGLLTRHARALEAANVKIAHANERLQEADRVRNELVHTISHDMANPLTPMKIQIRILAGVTGATGPAATALKVLDNNVRRLERLVGDLRDVALIESGQMKVVLQASDLVPVLEGVGQAFKGTLGQKSIALESAWPATLPVDLDVTRMEQVLYNLLSNARKFTPPGGTITLRAALVGRRVRVEVQDSGRGLDDEEKGRLFQMFSQVHSPPETDERGTGLGLFICKGIMERHGGRIWVDSAGHGRGSTFCVEIPARPEAP